MHQLPLGKCTEVKKDFILRLCYEEKKLLWIFHVRRTGSQTALWPRRHQVFNKFNKLIFQPTKNMQTMESKIKILPCFKKSLLI